jgi:protoporphyrinogen oxidase
MSRFIPATVASGAGDLLRERSEKDYGGMGPFYASLWLGLKFEWEVAYDLTAEERDPEDTTFAIEGRKQRWRKVEGGIPWECPKTFLGVLDAAPEKKETGISDADLEQLVKAATEHDYKGFVAAVMGMEASDGSKMAKNHAVVVGLKSPAWYEELRAEEEAPF